MKLYSLDAGEAWRQLGGGYKFATAYWSDDGSIIVDRSIEMEVERHDPITFESVRARARAGLSPNCAIIKDTSYRSSPCWPAGFDDIDNLSVIQR